MSIGTAVPTKSELSKIKHYFIQHKSIFDTYTVGDFRHETLLLLKKLFQNNDKQTNGLKNSANLFIESKIDNLLLHAFKQKRLGFPSRIVNIKLAD